MRRTQCDWWDRLSQLIWEQKDQQQLNHPVSKRYRYKGSWNSFQIEKQDITSHQVSHSTFGILIGGSVERSRSKLMRS
jgi:hypothetical protein